MKKHNNKIETHLNKNNLLETLIPVIEDSAKSLDLTVLEVAFNKERGNYFLRIFIYNHNKPVDHADCSNLSTLISDKIDSTNLIEVPYSLEVSSPGVNRKLKSPIEYEIFKDKEVKVILKKPLSPDEKDIVFIGKLLGLTEDKKSVIMEVNNNEKVLNLDNTKSVQLEG